MSKSPRKLSVCPYPLKGRFRRILPRRTGLGFKRGETELMAVLGWSVLHALALFGV